MYLARGMSQYMNRPRKYLNDDRTAARVNLEKWIAGLNVLVLPQDGNGDELVLAEEMQQALEWIAQLCFGGTTPDVKFRWRTMA
jgi:hypothetical protein